MDLLAAWNRLIDAPTAGKDLLARWREPHRHYHDEAHLASVLTVIDAHGGPDAVRLAAWFHDAVYDPRRDDNERRSAELATSVLRGHPDADRVAKLVRGTANHEPDGPDAALLYDADLAVLARPRAEYLTYVEAVRREYEFVPAAAFRAGRAAILRRFLDRPFVYALPVLRADWEAQARTNLTYELSLLDSGDAGVKSFGP